ncbi:MAG: cytochrome c [Gammaproteobacteria bacterium]|nr:cytochrome c [Gammaproteobacteria bacterium]
MLAGCDNSMRQQRKYTTYARAWLWDDQSAARPLPEHVVARGDLARQAQVLGPPRISAALLTRGRERYEIFCVPCHGHSGRGDGIVVDRGFPKPPSYLEPDLMRAPASTFYDAMSNGYGVMYAYASRLSPRDRWAIIAYIRALQLSGRGTLDRAADAPEQRS